MEKVITLTYFQGYGEHPFLFDYILGTQDMLWWLVMPQSNLRVMVVSWKILMNPSWCLLKTYNKRYQQLITWIVRKYFTVTELVHQFFQNHFLYSFVVSNFVVFQIWEIEQWTLLSHWFQANYNCLIIQSLSVWNLGSIIDMWKYGDGVILRVRCIVILLCTSCELSFCVCRHEPLIEISFDICHIQKVSASNEQNWNAVST